MTQTDIVHDMYSGALITYPKRTASIKYDFLFTKNTNWFYICSADSVEELENRLSKAVESHGESWQVVEAKTGEVVKQNRR